MDIGYGDCIKIRGHRYILTLIAQVSRYVCTYGIRILSGSDIIQELQKLLLDIGKLLSNYIQTLTVKSYGGHTTNGYW